MTLMLSLAGRQEYSKFLDDQFRDYRLEEESRIWRNLDAIKCRVDSVNTLFIVMGPGRLEKARPSS